MKNMKKGKRGKRENLRGSKATGKGNRKEKRGKYMKNI